MEQIGQVEIFWGKYPPLAPEEEIYNNIMDQLRSSPLVHQYPFIYDLMTGYYFGDSGTGWATEARQSTHQLRLKVFEFVKRADHDYR